MSQGIYERAYQQEEEEVEQEVRLQPYILPSDQNDDIFEISNYLARDVRKKAFEAFLCDDEFIHSREFKLFLYKRKGRELIGKQVDIPSEKSEEYNMKLYEGVKEEFENMTLEKGRELLKEGSCLMILGMDISP